jgi:hypothetical protein
VTFDDREPSVLQPDQTGPAWAPRTPDEVAPPAEVPAEGSAEVPADVKVPEPRPTVDSAADSAARRDRA